MHQNSDRIAFAQQYMEELCRVLYDLPSKDLARGPEVLEEALIERCQLFLAGSSGNAATASHMAEDIVKGVAEVSNQGFLAILLSDNVPLLTAIANDQSYSEVFASQLMVLGLKGDVLIVFSGWAVGKWRRWLIYLLSGLKTNMDRSKMFTWHLITSSRVIYVIGQRKQTESIRQ